VKYPKKEVHCVAAGRDQFCVIGPTEWAYHHVVLLKDRDTQALLNMINFRSEVPNCVFCARAFAVSPVTSWLYSSSQLPLYLAAGSNQGLVTVDAGGCVRLWETSLFSLEKSLMEWRQMIGSGM